MARRALLAAAVLVAMLGCAAASFNGGFGCKFFNYRDVRLAMLQQDPAVTEADVQARLETMANTNFYLCKSCSSKNMQFVARDDVMPGYGECWCLDGYGYSFVTTTNTNTGINKYTNFYGCTKCPTSAPNSNPTSGPYRPGSLPKKIDEATGEFDPASGGTAIAPLNRWINTPCTP